MPVIIAIWGVFALALGKNIVEVHPLPWLPPLETPVVMCNEKQGCWEYGNGKVHRVDRKGYPYAPGK